MSEIKERLQEVAVYYGLSIRKFEEFCNLKRGNISNIADGGSIGSDKLSNIIDNCGDISFEWLITGKGTMLKAEKPTKYIVDKYIKEIETRPRIPLNAAAGALSVCLDGITANKCEQMPIIGAFTRYDFTILVHGDSMEPNFLSGDELAGLYIKNTSFIQWGRTHILDTAQGIIVKNIYDNDDAIICKSENPRFSDFSIPKNEIYNIALVIGLIRRY